MSILSDFKKFAFKGNVVDLAVGVIIGGAFGKIVSALVADIIMPLVSLALPGGDWRQAGLVLREGAKPEETIAIKYGDFLGICLDFMIVAVVLFLVVNKFIKAIEARTKQPESEPAAAPTTKDCPYCLEKIPLAATRCRACTSVIEEAKAA